MSRRQDRVQRLVSALRRRGLREAEVENLHRAFVGDENVLGLEVAMDDAFRVRGSQAVRDLDGGPQQRLDRQRPGRQEVAQRAPFDQLHREVRDAVRLADIVDGDDVGVGQSGGGARFLLEAAARFGVDEVGGQDLERHVAAQPRVARAVHLAHAADADRIDDFVRSETRACAEWHRRRNCTSRSPQSWSKDA